jgi:hypothetical protein
MAEWVNALVFGLFLLAFTIGLSSVISAILPNNGEDALRSKVEYGFFGAAGLILSLVFIYALM